MSLFTETLQQFLDNRGGDFSASINELFAQIPDFVYTKTDGTQIKFSLKEMFVHDNRYKEIGAETEELFEYFLETRLDEVIVEYVPKIDLYLKHFGAQLLNRTVDVTRTEDVNGTLGRTRTTDGNSKDTSYVNPITKQSEKLTVQDVGDNEYADNERMDDIRTEKRATSESKLYSVFGKTNAQLLEEVMQLKNIYLEALHRLDNLFMYVV